MKQVTQRDRFIQRFAREYMKTSGVESIDLNVFVQWLLENGHLEADPKRIRRLLREDVSHALSEERFTDPDLRRVRKYHFLTRKRGKQQLSLCFPMENISRKDMIVSLQIRRSGLVSRAIQMQTDLDHFNKFVNKGEAIQLSFDLTNDIKEAEVDEAISQSSSSSEHSRPSSQWPGALPESASSLAPSRP